VNHKIEVRKTLSVFLYSLGKAYFNLLAAFARPYSKISHRNHGIFYTGDWDDFLPGVDPLCFNPAGFL